MSAHINAAGEFQSDKYPTCPAGKVPLSTKDSMAQDLLWLYAQRRRAVDAEFAEDLENALRSKGYEPPVKIDGMAAQIFYDIARDDGASEERERILSLLATTYPSVAVRLRAVIESIVEPQRQGAHAKEGR